MNDGIYELKSDIQNPNADKRARRAERWTELLVLAKGSRFRYAGAKPPYEPAYLKLVTGDHEAEKFYEPVRKINSNDQISLWRQLMEALKPVPASVETRFWIAQDDGVPIVKIIEAVLGGGNTVSKFDDAVEKATREHMAEQMALRRGGNS